MNVQFDGGAKRTGRRAPHFLVPIELMDEVAWTRIEGDSKYEPGNWECGDSEFFVDCLSHAIEHLILAPHDTEETIQTHLGHAATNIGFILWALKRGRVTLDDFRNACKVLKPRQGVAEASSGAQAPVAPAAEGSPKYIHGSRRTRPGKIMVQTDAGWVVGPDQTGTAGSPGRERHGNSAEILGSPPASSAGGGLVA